MGSLFLPKTPATFRHLPWAHRGPCVPGTLSQKTEEGMEETECSLPARVHVTRPLTWAGPGEPATPVLCEAGAQVCRKSHVALKALASLLLLH